MNNFLGTVVRFAVSAVVLMVVGFLVPGFGGLTFTTALLAAIMIAALGWVIERLFGRQISPFGRGIAGFLSSAVVLYVVQWFIPGMRVTFLGAIMAALIVGIVDLFVPGDVFRNRVHRGNHR